MCAVISASVDLADVLLLRSLIFLDFVKACCKVDPEKRLTADQALKHPWIVNETSRGTHDIGSDTREGIRGQMRRTGSLVESDRTRDLEPHEREDTPSSESSISREEEVGSTSSILQACWNMD